MKQAFSALAIFMLLAGEPVSVLASSHYTVTGIMNVIKTELLDPFITFLFVLGTAIFLWGVVEMLANPDNEEARATGRKHMIWGIVGLFIMLSVRAIITVLCNFWGATPCP